MRRDLLRRNTRRGISLIELLVVVAIIGVATGMLLPAVQAARESARRAQCASRLRQLGVALHAHHAQHRTFPAMMSNGWSWHARLLPHIEQQVVYRQYDFRRGPLKTPNSLRLDTQLQLLTCSSDPHGTSVHASPGLGGVRFAHTNFLGSFAGGSSRGMFSYGHGVRATDVTDGTSKTLFVGERGVVFDGANTHGWWTWGPAATIAATQAFQPGAYDDPATIVHWWSYHPGGANFLFVDGSLHFLAYRMDASAFTALGTRDAGDLGRL